MTRFSRAAIALACTLTFALPALAQTKWNVATAYPADNYHTENIAQFAKDVSAATGGKVGMTIHANASLFKAPEIKRAVQTGQAQMGEIILSLHENEDPIYGLDVVPFLAASFPEAKKLWDVQRAAVEKKLASQGLVLLFAVPWPPQGIYTKKDVGGVEDLKGLKFRAYSVGTSRIAELVGGQPVTVQAAELPQALATGVVNAVITSASTGYDSKIWESLTHFYDLQAWLPKNMIFVNKAALDALDKPSQDALMKAAEEAETRGWKLAEEKTKWYSDQLVSRGMKVVPPTAALKAGLGKIGEQLTGDWLKRAGPSGQAVVDAFRAK
ncbi:TRAP transporter substrate-binding protein [uncultured Enterovirga sp.]|uniref:TRAP transporter substrate-binding protein n=1 Tax=uncultured Enterovirga sp. TaxID=2026352 RepID=UPI0035CACC16